MDTPQSPPPGYLNIPPSEHSRNASPSPSYRSKFTAPELEGGSAASLPLAKGVDVNDPHYNYDTAIPYFPPPPKEKEKGRLFVPPRSYRPKSPSQTAFLLESERKIDTSSTASRLPSIVRLVLRVLTLIASPVVVGLLVHSLQLYTSTRDIKFSGTEESWPTSTNLSPVHFLIAVATISILTSLLALLQSLRNKFSAPISVWDIISMSCSIIILILWIASTVKFHQDDKPGKNSLIRSSCERKYSPNNHLISYKVICDEQV